MIKQSIYKGWCFLLALCLVACQQESMTEVAKGAFTIALADDTLGVQTKAQTAISEELAAKFQLTIRNAAGYTIYDGGYTSDPIPAPNGQYTLEARMGQNPDLAWEAPYYVGRTENVTVTAKETTSVAIPCTVGNAMVSARWTNQEKIDMVFTNYGLKVTVNRTSALLTPERESDKLYLKAGEQVSFYFVGTLISTGVEQTVPLQSEQLRSTLNPADHCILTLTVNDRLAMQIEKAEITRETINQTIPLEWLPKPKVEGFANQANLLTYVETADAIPAAISFSAAHTIQDIELTLALQDERLQSLNKTYLLSNLSEADAQALGEAGIALNRQEKGGNIDFTQMTARLITFKGEPVNNRIKLRVKANDRWSAEADAVPIYTIQTVKPEFSVSVYPKNIWTKEFTVNALMEDQVTTGSYERLKAQMHYQYSADGTTWETIGDDLCQKSLSPNQTYAVRAIYREGIYSNPISVTTYPETVLSSGDMEDWTVEKKGTYTFTSKSVLSYSLANWETNNSFTTRYILSGSNYFYNTFPAVACTKDAHSGTWAAELRNLSAGRHSSRLVQYDSNKVPGELFIGTIEIFNKTSGSDDYYVITEGIPYVSKPTALEFYYKYNPVNEDSWKVYIALFDQNDQIMATKEIIKGGAVDAYQKETIPLDYNEELYAEPTKIYVYFASSKSRGAELPYVNEDRNVTQYKADGTTQTMPAWWGSVFLIDDIQLIYDK